MFQGTKFKTRTLLISFVGDMFLQLPHEVSFALNEGPSKSDCIWDFRFQVYLHVIIMSLKILMHTFPMGTYLFNYKHINIKPLSHKTAIPQRLVNAQKYLSAQWSRRKIFLKY